METPVYRLNCTTFEIEKVITSGEYPGSISISDCRAVVKDRQIHITIDERERQAKYILDSNECCWYRESIAEGNG